MDVFDDDIFEQMRKMMRNPFTGFFDDSFFADEKAFDDELDNAIKLDPSKDKNSKSYSISYKFGTGMKEPEIHIQGDVDKDTVNHFLKGLPKSANELGFNINSTPALKSSKIHPDATEPYTEIHETDLGLNIYMEMPGIDHNDVKTKWDKESLIITAEREHILYEKIIPVAFKAKKDVKIESNNGIITLEIQKK